MKLSLSKRISLFIFTVGFCLFTVCGASAEPRVRFSCSAQIAEAFGKDVLKILKNKTGIELDLKVVSSQTALNRLENGFSDIAAITTPLSYEKLESGYVAIPFCKDPMVIIAEKDVEVDNITNAQIRGVFGGGLSNWKTLGGKDMPILKLIPCEETGAYSNFHRLFMGLKDIKYDFMTYCSVTTISGVKAMKGSISFISHGAAVKAGDVKILNVDGISPEDKDYQYFQTFTFVTKGKPDGEAKELIDIALSRKGQDVMKEKGMTPILP